MSPVLSTEILHPFQDGFYSLNSEFGSANPQPNNNSPQHIAIIDRRVDDLEALVASINNAEVFLLDYNQNGIEQISSILAPRHNIAGLHIISHGSSGSVQLGNASLNITNLTDYADRLQAWGNSLTPDADLLFYGCNVAADDFGKAFVQQVSQLTGADVAASTNLTGHADLSGDWDFEYVVGRVETDGIIGAAAQESYSDVLGTFNFANFTSTSGLRLNGNAAKAGDALRLTSTRNQVASVYSEIPIEINADTSFQTQFQFQLSGGTAGGDGFTFVLQNSDRGNRAVGSSNGKLGLGGPQTGTRARIDKSLAIEFDTFKNSWDPNNNHVAIVRDGRVDNPLAINSSGLPDLNNGSLFNAWINYDGNSNRLDVFLSDSTVRPDNPVLSRTIDLVPVLGSQAFVGFTASTSEQFNTQRILSWSFDSVNVNAPPPTVFSLVNNSTIFVHEGAPEVSITVARTGNAQEQAALEYTVSEVGGASTATANFDYVSPTFEGRENTGQVVFEIGETQKTFTIPIINDSLLEDNETFTVGLQNPSTGSLGTPRTKLVTIIDDDSSSAFTVSEASITVSEDTPMANVIVQRNGDISNSATINFHTQDNTAIAGEDYTAISGSLTFEPGQFIQTIAIPLINDTISEVPETFFVTLSDPEGALLGTQATATVTILDNDLSAGNLTRQTVVTGLTQPTTLEWTPDGRYMLVAQKNGIVRVVDNGTLLTTPLIDLSNEVNNIADRGLLGLAIHPNFPTLPYVYLLYTYDPPETAGQVNLAGPDGQGNRPSRLVRVTVDPATMIADPASLFVMAGTNSTWEYTSRPDVNSTGDRSILPSGIVNGTTIVAPEADIEMGSQDNDPDSPGVQNQNIRDYLATDSGTHSIGDIQFGPDGFLYFTNGDGTSYTFMDPRTVRVQDINNLSGKMLRIDPITGQGVASNPFYNGDPDSNQSKVFYYGLRNPFRFDFDPVTQLPVIGDVGWATWEEINTGLPGTNFGWPYLEGPNRNAYQSLSQAVAFYNNGNRNHPDDLQAVFPILARSHGAPDNSTAILMGDFYSTNLMTFGDINSGMLYAATLDDQRQVTNVQLFDSDIPYIVDMEMGPDNRLYGVNIALGTILRWNPA